MICFLVGLLLIFSASASAFDIDVTRVPLRAGTGTQNITFTNFSENCTLVPCAAIFVVSTGTVDGAAATHSLLGIGFTDGTRSVSQSSRSDSGAATTNTYRGQQANTELIHTIVAQGTEGSAAFSAWLTNGLRINVTNDFPAAYLLAVTIIGGSELSARADIFLSQATSGQATDIATVGFQPSIVFLAGTRQGSTVDSASPSFLFSVGVAVNDGASTQGSIGCFSADNVADADARAATSSLYAIQYVDDDTGSLSAAIEVGSWDASGFSATTRRENMTASGHSYLALGIGTLDAAVVDIATPTSTGASSVTVGFQSLFGMMLGTLAQAYDVGEADSDGGACMISMATADAQFSTMIHDDDAAATSNTGSISNDIFIQMEQDDGSCTAGTCFVGTLTSFGATAWNLNYTSVFSGAARRWVGLAIESPLAGPPVAQRRRSRPLVFH